MNANELRIGNYVNIGLNHSDTEIIQINARDLVAMESGEGVYLPTPLTKEWLEKLGFEYNYFEGYTWTLEITHRVSVWYSIPDECFTVLDKKIDFVHQIQNIFFDFKGEELTLKM